MDILTTIKNKAEFHLSNCWSGIRYGCNVPDIDIDYMYN